MIDITREELEEYRLYVQSRYDEYIQATEKRGASWGEVAYIEGLNKKELDDMCAELDEELKKLGVDNEN